MPVTFYTISGNAGAAGVTVALTGASTASTTSAGDGTYTFGGLLPGAYVVTPTLAGDTFTPASLPETIVAASITGVNFVASVSAVVGNPWSVQEEIENIFKGKR